jgi:hypothetical protein
MARLDRERLNMNLPPMPFGVGLHLGPVVYGNIGAPIGSTSLRLGLLSMSGAESRDYARSSDARC